MGEQAEGPCLPRNGRARMRSGDAISPEPTERAPGAAAGLGQPPGPTSPGATARGACLAPGQPLRDRYWPAHTPKAKADYARAAMTRICADLARAKEGRRLMVLRAATVLASYCNIEAFDEAQGVAMIKEAAAQCARAQRDDPITSAEVADRIAKGLRTKSKAPEPKHRPGKAGSRDGEEWSLSLLAYAASTKSSNAWFVAEAVVEIMFPGHEYLRKGAPLSCRQVARQSRGGMEASSVNTWLDKFARAGYLRLERDASGERVVRSGGGAPVRPGR